jgi:transcriptional regulator with XRE-family HTH domain
MKMPQSRTKQTQRQQESAFAAGDFGDRLRRARTDRGLTLRDVSETSGISIAYLSDLERGVLVNPTLDKLRQLALALEVSLNELLGVVDQPPQRRLPKALDEFRALSNFRQAVAEEARKSSREADQLEDEWLETLSRIHVGGRRPKDAADYLFIFEAIRRAIERR